VVGQFQVDPPPIPALCAELTCHRPQNFYAACYCRAEINHALPSGDIAI
jgi:hypothetical protein